MLDIDVPGLGVLRLAHLVLDVNGTLTLEGALLSGVAERIAQLRRLVDVYLVSADTFGQLDAIAAQLGVQAVRLRAGEPEAEQKASFVGQLGTAQVVAIGNGANDAAMLRAAALGMAVLGPEGLAVTALGVADVLAVSIDQALDLLLKPKRLIATLRR